jgi:hypothetical protein
MRYLRQLSRLAVRLATLFIAVLVAACADAPSATSTPEPGVRTGIAAVDAAAGAPALIWLPPLGTNTSDPATFDATAAPVVEICAWSGSACIGVPVARFATAPTGAYLPLTINAPAGQYEASWSLMDARFTSRQTYRIRAIQGVTELDAVSVDVVRGRWALTRTDGSIGPLASAVILPIRFRIAKVVVPPGTQPALVQIDASLPAAARAQLSKLYSLVDGADVAASVHMLVPELSTGREPIVVALNGRSEVILAAVAASGGAMTLSAGSTARALVRALLASLDGNRPPPAAADALITGHPLFGDLTAAIHVTASAARPFAESNVVPQLAAAIARDVGRAMLPRALRARSGLATVATAAPHVPTFSTLPVKVGDAAGVNVAVINSGKIWFEGFVESPAGRPLSAPQRIAPAESPFPGVFVDEETPLRAVDGEFLVAVGTGRESAFWNGTTALSTALGLAFDVFGPPIPTDSRCIANFAERFITPLVVSQIVAGDLRGATGAVIGHWGGTIDLVFESISDCANWGDVPQASAKAMLKWGVSVVMIAWKATLFVYQDLPFFIDFNLYGRRPVEKVKVCQWDGAIEGCEISLVQITTQDGAPPDVMVPPGRTLLVGERLQLKAVALDRAVWPIRSRTFTWSLLWQSSGSVIAAVDAATGLVTAGTAPGEAQIKATTRDRDGTEKSAIAYVTVAPEPRLTVRLDPFGEQLLGPGPYRIELVNDLLLPVPAPDAVTVTLDRIVLSCLGDIFPSQTTVVVPRGQSTVNYSPFVAGRHPACPGRTIKTRYTVTRAVLGVSTELDLNKVPSEQRAVTIIR